MCSSDLPGFAEPLASINLLRADIYPLYMFESVLSHRPKGKAHATANIENRFSRRWRKVGPQKAFVEVTHLCGMTLAFVVPVAIVQRVIVLFFQFRVLHSTDSILRERTCSKRIGPQPAPQAETVP